MVQMTSLIELLDEQKECYDGLLTLAQYKREAIMGRKLQLLNQVVGTEEQFIQRVELIDQKREEYSLEIAKALGIEKENVTLTDMIEKLEETDPFHATLCTLRKQLRGSIEELRKANELNKILLKDAMEITESMMQAASTRFEYLEGNQYGGIKTGNIQHSRHQFFDIKQ